MSEEVPSLAKSTPSQLQIVLAPTTRAPHVCHQIFDMLCAITGLVLLSPLLIAIGTAIKFRNDGPVLYSQRRIGRHFRAFRVYKFRTMVPGTDKSGLLTGPGDSRVTPLGKLLRRHKLDELPQLLNVVKGDMQLVGSRPEVERYVELFLAEYSALLQDRPGITDPATIAHRREETLLTEECVEEQYTSRLLPAKLRMSLEYQQRRSFFSDLKVLFRTLASLFK